MPLTALFAVLLAATTHATWNLYAKRAAGARHFVWLYSLASVLLLTPLVLVIVQSDALPPFGLLHWAALVATAVLHLGYSLVLQAAYRVSELSLIYPIARGAGPLLSFFGAVVLLDERLTLQALLGVLLVVVGILLVAGLTRELHKVSRPGILYGLGIGAFIAGYTVNDGWAVKVLLISPILVDYAGTVLRVVCLTPFALRDRARAATELRDYWRPAVVVGVLGPLGYILVLFAMRAAPVSHVAPARELATLIAAYFGARLLGEKGGAMRLLGAACIVAGVVSLALAPSD
jgi:drug/metabolite transporter (DMT)-like permease